MVHPNVFAVLTASHGRNKACAAIRRQENKKWFRPACLQPARRSRGPSRGSVSYGYDSGSDSDEGVDRLVFRFDEVLHSAQTGLQFGTDPTLSDVVIGDPGAGGISRRQYIITADSQLRIWLHDPGSMHGTAVSCVWSTKIRNENAFKAADTWIMAFAAGAKKARFDEGAETLPGKPPGIRQEMRAPSSTYNAWLPGHRFQSVPMTQNPTVHHTPRESLVYIRLGKLGAGSFGTVHKAIRARDGETVAVKTFEPPSSLSKRSQDEVEAEWISDINREFSLARDHRHPNVLEILDFVEKPKPVMVMCHYPAGNLKSCEDSGLLTCEHAVNAFGQTLDGLRFLHRSNLPHRDLKPENILVTMEPLFKVVIADFGFAKAIENDTLLQSSRGTLRYKAPELYSHDGYGLEADIWSLGVLGLEIIYQLPKSPKDASASR